MLGTKTTITIRILKECETVRKVVLWVQKENKGRKTWMNKILEAIMTEKFPQNWQTLPTDPERWENTKEESPQTIPRLIHKLQKKR
jgi:hypothetical protein